MTISIYKKEDNSIVNVYHNVSWFEIINGVIYGNIDGDELTIDIDFNIYSYWIH